jgi:hypothetical protein
MFLLSVSQNRLLIMAGIYGIVVTLSLVIGALDMRRDRPPGGERATPLLPTRHTLPWFVIFSNVVILALGIIYTVATIINPPNW